MKNRYGFIVLALVVGLFCWMSSNVFAVTIMVDGNLTGDWGVDPSNTHWIPNSTSTATGTVGSPITGSTDGINYWVEDAVGTNGYVEPGWGAQDYDVQALYLTFDDNYVYGAVVTGFPVGGNGKYLPGDLAFDFGADGTYEYGVAVIDHDNLTAGNLYDVSEWAGASIFTASNPYAISTGSSLGGAEFFYGNKYNRTVIEVAIEKSLFTGIDWSIPQDIVMHWTMQCGNDAGDVRGTAPVPEPGTIMLVGAGLLGLALGRRKKKA